MTGDGTSWHSSKAVELPYEACFINQKFDFATMNSADPPVDPVKSEQYDNLMLFYTGLGGVSWRNNDNWGYGDPCYFSWYGLECDCDGLVTKMILPDNRLVGEIPEALGALVSLREIHLQTSTKLMQSYVNFDANKLTGTIPSLSELTNLQVLDVSQNLLEGWPADLNLNVNLEVLNAAGNKLTGFPASLGDLTNLRILELNDNLIDAEFPLADVCALSNVYILNFGNSSMSGPLYDDCLQGLNPLIFDVSAPHPAALGYGAGLTGEVPVDLIESWTNIKQGYLSVYLQFGLSGQIPETCSDLRFCRWYQFGSHRDLAWTEGGAEVPDYVYETIDVALEH